MAEHDDRERFWRAVLGIGTCMMVTKQGGALHGRPMQALPDSDEETIWFLSDAASHKEEEITADPSTCLTFADPEDDVYVSVSGEVELVRDREKLAELWSPEAEDYFEGPDDPNIVVLRFTPRIAGIWDGSDFEYEEDDENGDDEATTEGTTITFGGAAE